MTAAKNDTVLYTTLFCTMSDTFGLQHYTQGLLSFIPSMFCNVIEFHRDADKIDLTKETYYVYTGRGPSKASFHIGHLPGLKLCLALQTHLKTQIQFMIADDEKMIRDGIPYDTMRENVSATLEQLHALGFTEGNTHFRINSSGITSEEYTLVVRMLSMVSMHTLDSVFGSKTSVGDYFYPLIQILPCMRKDMRCIVVAGVDQDPFFRLARDIARRLGYPPPIVLYTRNVPGLDGSPKMSTSVPASMPIYLSDTLAAISAKVAKIRQVGAGSLEELFEHGADLTRDVPYQLLQFFDVTEQLPLITTAYTTGIGAAEAETLRELVGEKGVRGRPDGRYMLTSAGIRTHLTRVLQSIISEYRR